MNDESNTVSAGEPAHDRLMSRLRTSGVGFELTEHAPVFTSEEAAQVRGAELRSGAKALVLRAGERYVLAVLPASLALDSKALRQALGTRRIRFASREELLALTGLTPGAVPPFGSLFGIDTFADVGLAENERINFNAASHSRSVQLAYADWLQLEQPHLAAIARPQS